MLFEHVLVSARELILTCSFWPALISRIDLTVTAGNASERKDVRALLTPFTFSTPLPHLSPR